MASTPASAGDVVGPDFGIRDSSTSEYFKAAHTSFVKCKNAANVSTLQTAISRLDSTLSSIGDITDPHSIEGQYHLAKACLMRFNHIGNKNDVFRAYSCYYNARVTVSFPDIDLPESYLKVNDPAQTIRNALNLLSSYSGNLDPKNLENAISLYEKTLSVTEISDEEQWKSLLELSDLILLQYHSTNDPMLLNQALSYMRKASSMQPLLSICLAAVLLTVAQANPSEDLDAYILNETRDLLKKAATEDAIALETEQAGNALYDEFEQSGDLQDLNDCIGKLQQTVVRLSWRHPSRGYVLGTLGGGLSTRFQCQRNLGDLYESIKVLEKALELQPAPHPNFVALLVNLALGLQTRFEQQADIQDLEKAIELFKEALHYCSDLEIQSIIFNNLATAFKARFKEKSEPNDLHESIKLMKKTLSLRPVGHPDRGIALNNLATVIQLRFNLLGALSDIEVVIELCREALTLHPISHPRIQTLDHLASGLRTRFEQQRTFSDLEEAIQFYQEAVNLCSKSSQVQQGQRQGSPIFDAASDHSTALLNLASAVQTRFLHQGDIMDLEKVVELYRKSFDVCVPYNAAESIENLAGGLQLRFERKGHAEDLEESITLHKQALKQMPPDHSHRGTIAFNLARALRHRFEKNGNMDDLQEAIMLYEEALTLSPSSHPERRASLSSLANALLTKLEHNRQIQGQVEHEEGRKESRDLQKIIELQREALNLSVSHADRSDTLNNLANVLHVKFNWNGGFEALEESIMLCREALMLRSSPHSKRGSSLASLASVLATRYKHKPSPGDLTACIFHAQEASSYLYATPLDQLRYARTWGQIAAELDHDSALVAYRQAINLLPQIAALHLDVVTRHSVLSILQASQLASEAAACAINKADYGAAVELLEASRSVFWSQAIQLQTPINQLEHAHPQLASELKQLKKQLEQASFRDTSRAMDKKNQKQILAMEAEGANYEQLNKDWNSTIQLIRRWPTFEDFMLPKMIDALLPAAGSGSIVILATRSSICYALIVTRSTPIQCIHLSQIDTGVANFHKNLCQALSRSNFNATEFLAESARGITDSKLQHRLFADREGLVNITSDQVFRNLLAELWTSIVRPIFDALDLKKTNHPPRLWWCPTGSLSFLPLHAAGIYNSDNAHASCVSDYVISSYTPTLTALLDPPLEKPSAFKMTAVIQPTAPTFSNNFGALPGSRKELNEIKKLVPDAWLVSLGDSSRATVKAALGHLRQSSLVHFACHGAQDLEHPLNSRLVLSDGHIKVSDLMRRAYNDTPEHITKGLSLAFLSACETAKGDAQTPDEAIHLAATLLFSGFRSVVATMWTMQDGDGPHIAKEFYQRLFKGCSPQSNPPIFPDLTKSAEALHYAVMELRKQPNMTYKRWVPFVHYGL
ncbi:CHAT domain-containing protein [Mycena latifolia]|nr:CHAT domain-containing protein [Mycena latifolia]